VSYSNFSDYIEQLSNYSQNRALTSKSFLKNNKLSYQQLQTKSYQTARFLLDQGIIAGDRVMVMAENSPSWLELFLGTQLIGAILVPIDMNSSLEICANYIKLTTPKLLFKSKYLLSELKDQLKIYNIQDLESMIDNCPETKISTRLTVNSPSLIVFTSGTTADPKGVELTQGNILANISGIQEMINIDSDWRLLSVLPLSHMYELTGSLSILSRGASIYYLPRVTPLAISRALVEYQINTLLAIPQLISILLERIEQEVNRQKKQKLFSYSLKVAKLLPFSARRVLFRSVHKKLGGHLSLVVTGGAPVPLEVGKTWELMGVVILQGYGLSETSPILSVNGLNQRRIDSAGRVLSNVQMRIAKDGEIQVKGPSIFTNYWRNKTATVLAFTKDGWFKTGDIGSIDNDGYLHIQGRLKFAIVLSSGLKVFPEDIELVANRDDFFKDFCVVGVKYSKGEHVVAVVITDRKNDDINKEIDRINSKLESFQHIHHWRRWPVDDFPRTRLLKVDRRKVQSWANNEYQEDQINTDTGDQAEDQIINLINMSLDKPILTIKTSDKLANIGLDSLRRLNLVALIEEHLSISIPEEKVTKDTSVGQLKKLIKDGVAVESSYQFSRWTYWPWIRFLGNGVREIVISSIIRIWVKINVQGLDNINNLQTPAIFIFNHTDDFDGPVIYKALPAYIRQRLCVATADDVLKEHAVLAFIVRFCFAGFNFARQEPYTPSLEYLSQRLDKGWNVLLSPEGKVSKDGNLQPFKSGIGLLAVNLNVPIVPIKSIGLHGTLPLHSKWPKKRSTIIVRIGQPIIFNSNTDYNQATDELYSIMYKL